DTSQEHPAVVPCPTASGMPPSVDLRYVRIVPFGSLFSRTPRTIPTAGYSAAIPVPIAIATGATAFASSPAYLQAAGVAWSGVLVGAGDSSASGGFGISVDAIESALCHACPKPRSSEPASGEASRARIGVVPSAVLEGKITTKNGPLPSSPNRDINTADRS